jgi:hypothetical protein
MNRSKGGWEKHKAAEEKQKQKALHIAALPKISTFVVKAQQAKAVDVDPYQSDTAPDRADARTDAANNEETTSADMPISKEAVATTPAAEDTAISFNPDKVAEKLNSSDAATDCVVHVSTDAARWPKVDEYTIDYLCKLGPDPFRHSDSDLSATKRVYLSQTRYLTKTMFYSVRPNEQKVHRDWLIYSPSAKRVYCFYCKLFNQNKNKFSGEGFDDWKNPTDIGDHEKLSSHRAAVVAYISRCRTSGRVDEQLQMQLEEEKQYWRSVLKRVVAVTTFLCERGLAFRGDNEILGSPHNGNFMGMIELLAKFDPFLNTHIDKHGNRGSGRTSYLTKTVYEEVVLLMAEKVSSTIVDEIKDAVYFSVSVDSTPDVSHVDQLTVIIRYVSSKTHEPIERFLTLLPLSGHTGAILASTLLQFLEKKGINIKFCRGQSYDNASNMSGKYEGMQAKIKEVCKYAEFVPCAAHSLNLVGVAAVNCCVKAASFFDFLNNIYTFFAASTARWALLLSQLGAKSVVPKNPSQTRWSARADATASIVQSYEQFLKALKRLAEDSEQKWETRSVAKGLIQEMRKLETAILVVFWNDILRKFNLASKSLQDSHISLDTVTSLYVSLESYVGSLRGEFQSYEQKGMELCQNTDYSAFHKRRAIRKRFADESTERDVAETMSASDNFRVTTFLACIDQLQSSLRHRLKAYSDLQARFIFFGRSWMDDKTSGLLYAEASRCAVELSKYYPEDLDRDFQDELRQFVDFVKVDAGGKLTKNAAERYYLLCERKLSATFPNVMTSLKIYLSIMVTNCSGERSFSKMNIIKSCLRSTMAQSRLDAMSLLSIESDIVRDINFDDVIDCLSASKSRKVPL